MVAKTPIKDRKMAALNPNLVRETVKKVDKVMARLQELQYTVSGGTKVIGGVSLSPRSTRGYLRTSLRCKQECVRIKNGGARKTPAKIEVNSDGEWRRMSLPAMLVEETVGEILQASRFAKEVVAAVREIVKPATDDPKTPASHQKQTLKNLVSENREMLDRRKREKQGVVMIRSEYSGGSPTIRRARSRINFKVSAANERVFGRETHHLANRISPKNRPWAKKAVLFPNPLFLSSPSQKPKFCKIRSPIITRTRTVVPRAQKFLSPPSGKKPEFCKTRSPVIITRTRTVPAAPPHKFLIKSPPSSSKFSVKLKNSPICLRSPTRLPILSKKSSPPRKLRRSFSPSNLANRLVSPLKNRLGSMSGLKQRPSSRKF